MQKNTAGIFTMAISCQEEQIPADAAISDNEKYRVYDSDKCFIGVYEFRDEVLYPVKIFYEDNK
ncbi:MAG: hypothetical protein ACLR7D_17060 [Lachnospira eligens]